MAKAGVWSCENCGTQNTADLSACRKCGRKHLQPKILKTDVGESFGDNKIAEKFVEYFDSHIKGQEDKNPKWKL